MVFKRNSLFDATKGSKQFKERPKVHFIPMKHSPLMIGYLLSKIAYKLLFKYDSL